MESVSIVMAFFAGVIIFLSPCVLPLIPIYIAYLSGISLQEISRKELTREGKRRIRLITALHSLSFIIGFTVVFTTLGASVTFLGQLLSQYQWLIKKVGGLLIIFFAFIVMGVIKIPFLQKERKISYKKEGISVLGSVLVGATFAAAWTPCVGPILGSILVYASSSANVKKGIVLLSVFSLGLGVPFFLSAILINSFFIFIKRMQEYLRLITAAFGIILAIFGFILLVKV